MINARENVGGGLASWMAALNGNAHRRALSAFMLLVFAHWAEHIAQAYQVFVLGWSRPAAGGLLGLWFPFLATSKVLHFAYNFTLFFGLACLRPGFQRRARAWWTVALVVQGWHLFERTLLQGQWLTGFYLFGATQQASILQLWIPRVELHFLYNSLVFIPMLPALFFYRHAHR